jgi:hypothetical protein
VPLSRADQESLHRFSTRNRDQLAKSQQAGCFYCCAIFAPSEVEDWVDGPMVETGDTQDGVTALCPRCGIDSVLPEIPGVPVTPALLAEMKAHWFS